MFWQIYSNHILVTFYKLFSLCIVKGTGTFPHILVYVDSKVNSPCTILISYSYD